MASELLLLLRLVQDAEVRPVPLEDQGLILVLSLEVLVLERLLQLPSSTVVSSWEVAVLVLLMWLRDDGEEDQGLTVATLELLLGPIQEAVAQSVQ